MVNYHHLLYFREIARFGSVSRAAENLGLGQPALSSQLKSLEEYFGEELFTRQNRKMILTEAGKIALGYADDIFDLGNELEEVMAGKAHTPRPHLRVGSLSSIPKHVVTNLVEFIHESIDCQFTITEDKNEDLVSQLLSHKIELFISNHNPTGDKSIYSKRLARMPIDLYGAAKYRHLSKQFPKSLNEQPIILPTKDSKLFHDVEHFLERNNISYKVAAIGQDTAVQKLLASHGFGLTPQPEFSVVELVEDKKLFKIGRLSGVYEEFYIVTTRKRSQNPLVDKIMSEYKIQN